METSSRKSYPRALPFRSPEDITAEAERRQEAMQDRLDDLAAQAAHLRRWASALGLTLAGAVVLATTLTVLLVQRPSAPDTAPPLASLPAPPAPPALAAPARPALAAMPAAPPAPATPPAPSPSPSPATEPPIKAATLEAMGGLSAANLYQSYLAIGLLADGVQHKAFTVEGAANTLKVIGSCLSLVDTKLATLDKLNLDPNDQASLRQIKAVTALMRIQTQALERYWATGKAEHREAYQRTRKATWTGLSKVLGAEG